MLLVIISAAWSTKAQVFGGSLDSLTFETPKTNVHGTIKKNNGGDPIDSALVSLTDTTNIGNIFSTISTEDGTYKIDSVPTGNYFLYTLKARM